MDLSLLSVVVLLILTVWWYISRSRTSKLDHIPGPKGELFWGNRRQIDPDTPHIKIRDWHKQYGSVIRIRTHIGDCVIVGGLDAMKELMVSRTEDYSDRPLTYRWKLQCRDGGVVMNSGERQAVAKKLLYKQLKPYGEGMAVIGSVVEQVSDELFQNFRLKAGKPYDALDDICQVAIKTMAFFVLGGYVPDDHRIMEIMRGIVLDGPSTVGTFGYGEILDRFPWMRPFMSLRDPRWNNFEEQVTELIGLIRDWNKENSDKETFTKLLTNHLEGSAAILKESDVLIGPSDMMIAGSITSTYSFYTYITTIKKHPEIQQKLYDEIQKTVGTNSQVLLDDRRKMPYAFATTLELQRYATVTPFALPHKAKVNSSLAGYHIPEGTTVFPNLWQLHHDPDFWRDPDEFSPERFLDESGDVVSVDHPVRRHMLAFGGGLRGCPGENLAMTRLFMWITTLTQMFEVLPVEGHDHMVYGAVVRPADALIQLKPRK